MNDKSDSRREQLKDSLLHSWQSTQCSKAPCKNGTMEILNLVFVPRLTLAQASLVAQLVKNPSAVRETWVQSLGWDDPLEKGKATHSSILAWRILWTV